ncbi:MAG TPA: fimbria/pilus periplasmic chaperone [Sphingomicrobium sp.]|nr:fimbria/pilus periplasmic chaperone [Sphingomicrobium sp.]
MKRALLGFAALATLAATPAWADLVLSDLIVELAPGKQVRRDVEVWNNSPERAFVSVDPREVVNPGLQSQSIRQDPDPERLGLLASPRRMILEPGQRKLLRIASLSSDETREHVYRVMVKPVVADVQSDDSGLKVMVGYDVLVLVRPVQPVFNVTGARSGRRLTFTNSGNTSVEIVDGRQCRDGRAQCSDLPGKRLYPGVTWSVDLPLDLPAGYTLKSAGRTDRKSY